jgi:diguanylate cyclase (GGDEF)-like protein
MTIYNKVVLTLASMIVTLLIVFLFIQKFIVFPTFESLEQQYAKADIDRVEEVILNTINLLDRQVYDWSSWDDTYKFIENQNIEYINSNLPSDTFSNLNVNLVYFLDTEFKPVWVQTYNFDIDDVEQVEITTDDKDVQQSILLLQSKLEELTSLPSDEPQVIRGLMFQHRLPIAFSIRPIFNSDEIGAANGYLIFGRNLNRFTLERFGEQIKKEFKIDVVAKNPLSMSDFSTNNYEVDEFSKDMLNISKSYFVDGKTVFRISSDYHRMITQTGQNSIKYALFSSLAIGVIMILIIAVLLEKRVFILLSNLTKQMQGISQSKNYTMRAIISSQDEIGVLSSEFNHMLSVIEQNNDELVEANEQIKAANLELEKLSLTDALTQLNNRLGLERKLRIELGALSRKQSSLAIVMIDMDYFKLFNDHYGHIEGDKCLRQVSNILNDNTRRPRDMAARFGGEEFTLVLPETNIQAALQLAKHIQNDIANSKIQHKLSNVSEFVTVSIGISCLIPTAAMSVDSIMQNADEALYTAKKNGRNRIEISENSDIEEVIAQSNV